MKSLTFTANSEGVPRREQSAWRIASEIPNHKFQIPNKLQIPIPNDQNAPHLHPLPSGERGRERGFRISKIGIYLLFGAGDLVLV
jgi:hypothetical protein